MSKPSSQRASGLSPKYETYERQKCFIAYTEQTPWSDDLLAACDEVLSRPEFNLEPDYARKHFDPDVTLREKALELIANARYGIYDLSNWQDDDGRWHIPRNVFIELGMAIALNRPTLLLRHANNRELELPDCLKSLSRHILHFSGETTLKWALEERLPQWVSAPPEREWWNCYCIFGGRVCEYREAHPRAIQWGQQTLWCHISDGPDVNRPDFRGVVEHVLDRCDHLEYEYLDALPIAKGYEFMLCTHCQAVRSSAFNIYRLTHYTLAETYVALGMNIALEVQFEYKIPKIILTNNIRVVPSLLAGYEVLVASNDKETKDHLQEFISGIIVEVRKTRWKSSPLPFIAEPTQKPTELVPVLSQKTEESVHINELLRDRVTQLWKVEPYASIILQMDISLDDAATVHASQAWLLEALDIIIDNAVEAMTRTPTKQLTIGTRLKNGGAIITVVDTGHGIPKDLQAKLFQKPVEKSKKDKHSGIGLFQAAAIMRAYQGNIRLESTGPTGTTMEIWLPLEQSHLDEKTILLADNDIDFLETRAEFLEREGYNVIKVASPREARAVIAQKSIDLAIFDLRLEDDADQRDISGIELTRETRTIPVILMTAYPSEIESEVLISGAEHQLLSSTATIVAKEEGLDVMRSAVTRALSTKTDKTEVPIPEQALNNNIWIDFADEVVWVERRQVDLTPQDYAILSYLYQHANKLQTRQDIVSEVLGEGGGEQPWAMSRLNSAMGRLRQKVEPDPKRPKYLVTVRGRGYKLVL